MRIVTGTKRSGTSMWMQILRAAGIPVYGEPFLRDWKEVLADANPEGFYESPLRGGIYYQTNPNPRTGEFLHPHETRELAVKVFIPGLVRSDLAYVDKVLATMRNWREYCRSVQRLENMERENREWKDGKPRPSPAVLSPVHAWWRENFSLLSDVLTRRYPIHMTAYESVLADPETVVPEAVEWLGGGDAEQAVASVKPALRTFEATEAPDVPGIEPEIAEVLDELYARVRDRRGLDQPFIERLNATNDVLEPRIRDEMAQVRRTRRDRRREARAHLADEHGQGNPTSDERSSMSAGQAGGEEDRTAASSGPSVS